jgi:hypothetical protein
VYRIPTDGPVTRNKCYGSEYKPKVCIIKTRKIFTNIKEIFIFNKTNAPYIFLDLTEGLLGS